MAQLFAMRLRAVSWRIYFLGILLVLILYVRLRPSLKPLSSDFLRKIAQSRIQQGAQLPLVDENGRSEDLERWRQLVTRRNDLLTLLTECPVRANPYTQQRRLQYPHHGISFIPTGSSSQPDLRLFNPALLPLPSWSSPATYLVLSRVVTEGLHQESLICLADFCLPPNTTTRSSIGTRSCTEDDITALGDKGGLRCRITPVKLNIPPTPALQCDGSWSSFPDIPGFHDPRIFWSGKGEPLIILNSASQYGCIGLWVADLRTLFPELENIVNRHGKYMGPVMSYPHLAEITRNPRSGRASVEKNWMLWFPGDDGEAYVQYDLGPMSAPLPAHRGRDLNQTIFNHTAAIDRPSGRAFARLIGNGFTTPNLTSPYEPACFDKSHNYDSLGKQGQWHQGSNSLRLIVCTRLQARAGDCGRPENWNSDGREVHFAIMHRKFSNEMDLPMRYERYVAVWEGRPPFRMLGISNFPLLMIDEWARPWSEAENWPEAQARTGNWTLGHNKRGQPVAEDTGRSNVYFTYTPSLAWAWRPGADPATGPDSEGGQTLEEKDIDQLSRLGTGYLGDEVLVGIGLEDVGQAVARVKVDELVQCLRLCPGANA